MGSEGAKRLGLRVQPFLPFQTACGPADILIGDCADPDGLWDGSAASAAADFRVSEDEAHAILSDLCDRHLIEKIFPGRYAIVKWRERNESSTATDPIASRASRRNLSTWQRRKQQEDARSSRSLFSRPRNPKSIAFRGCQATPNPPA